MVYTSDMSKTGAQPTGELTLGGQTLRLPARAEGSAERWVSAPGRLLAEALRPPAEAQVLLLGCSGGLAVALARQAARGALTLLSSSAPDLAQVRRLAQANSAANITPLEAVSVLPERADSFDFVALELPKGRGLARRWLVEAAAALRPGGTLYLAGANDEGIQPVLADAGALFGNLTPLGYRDRCRIGRATKGAAPPAPDWAAEPGIAPGTWRRFAVALPGLTLELECLPGVFSAGRLDDGTRLLLETLAPPVGLRVLDIGCGYGAIGLWAAGAGAAHVDLVDSNLLAVASARRNLAAQGLRQVEVLAGDALAPVAGRSYDLVVTNPPFHEGKSVDYQAAHRFIAQARAALRPGGRLALVANRFLPYERVIRPLFGDLERAADDRRYQVWVARRP